jgi:hypothetical protein
MNKDNLEQELFSKILSYKYDPVESTFTLTVASFPNLDLLFWAIIVPRVLTLSVERKISSSLLSILPSAILTGYWII